MKKVRVLMRAALLLVASASAGCATGYGDMHYHLSGGYYDKPGPGELIKVGFSGNSFISSWQAGVYMMFRCAEVARREGKPYLAVYPSLAAAVADRRGGEKSATLLLAGKPVGFVYILLFDEPGPGLMKTDDLYARLEPKVRGGEPK